MTCELKAQKHYELVAHDLQITSICTVRLVFNRISWTTLLNSVRRIETAIQRYFAKRNLDSDRKNLFDKYLTYGGIAGGPKMFSGGLDAKTIANSNSAEIATLTATHAVAFDQSDPRSEMYVVDFEGCLRGFL